MAEGTRLTHLDDRGEAAKGDVLAVARIAGIMAAKRTHELIPLCHPLAVSGIEVSVEPAGDDRVEVTARVKVTGRTGVEMEALTDVSLLPVETALAQVLDGVAPVEAEEVPVGEAADRVLAGDLAARRTQPPF